MKDGDAGIIEIVIGLYMIMQMIVYYQYYRDVNLGVAMLVLMSTVAILLLFFSFIMIIRGLVNIGRENQQMKFAAVLSYLMGMVDLKDAARSVGMSEEEFEKLVERVRKGIDEKHLE